MIYLRNIAFYLTFYGGSIVLVIAAVIAAYIAPSKVRGICEAWSGLHNWACRKLLGLNIVETGERPDFQAFYAVKHESFFEAINVPYGFDRPALFAKQELFAIPGWGLAARLFGAIPVKREEGARALRTMIKDARPFVDAGRPIVIFPEGTRVPHGERPPLGAGFAALYKLLGLPVVPVAVDSGPLYQRTWKPRGTITMHFGEPIEAGLPRKEIEARVHAAINALNDHRGVERMPPSPIA
ncbi:lysophospholipid acyltransferase family protein [Aurantiacibacter poecillastricola]|uniref:lysophospholipid acyltransferase family protein n=1 Tax=Aurantiacibacter poecillastricola TaxID=3064385 RepID=UPI00273EA65C|nr:lysophospholipid acyltransferase family protein [Aurantiacibacter sp. 219JJ12-13]MDP5260175.1 lysophospholipid acyltransferase family protein [Aurantiacibacter sp. 219JJ12-13]